MPFFAMLGIQEAFKIVEVIIEGVSIFVVHHIAGRDRSMMQSPDGAMK